MKTFVKGIKAIARTCRVVFNSVCVIGGVVEVFEGVKKIMNIMKPRNVCYV